MAEVRLRLLKRSSQLQGVEDVIPRMRSPEPVVSALCMTPVLCNTETSACGITYNHRKWTLCLHTIGRGRSMWLPGDMSQITTPGARFYTQWNGSRASFHQTEGRHRSHNNRFQESEVPLYRTRTGYYDILEVPGNASQAQVKTAYYKQSFRFHPDRNNSNKAAAKQFSQITEAYHVLGSTTLRKKYDRGTLTQEDVRTAKKPSGKSSSQSSKEAAGHKQDSGNSSTSVAKPMFDFDAFYQAHYGEQLEREKQWKERREHLEKKKREQQKGRNLNNMSELSALLIFLPAFLLYLSFRG